MPSAVEAYGRSIDIPTTLDLTSNDHTLTLHKLFLRLNLTHMNIMDYQWLQSLNITQLTSEQLKKMSHKLPNYNMVNSLKEYIKQIDGNYPYSMPTWLMILITALGTLIYLLLL